MLPIFVTLAMLQTPESAFDFWVGEWILTGKSRNAPGKEEYTDTKATNSIKKVLNGKVVEENFSMSGFKGRSWTTYNPRTKKWNQTWVDDTGSYLLFEGATDQDGMTLNQTNCPPGIKMRMTFRDIKKDSIKWLWQRSSDDGKTWETQWELNYKRAKTRT